MELSEVIKQQQNISLLAKGLILHSLIIVSFAVIYTVYTYHVHDDFGLRRDNMFDTAVNAAMLSSFVSAGSIPPHIDHTSSFSRVLLICNVILSSLTKVWMITSEG
uniref:Potassium channel domain-containing protein n=1 Tax=viral metagenome TaxID=1070528 RepID=A0A6C0J2Z0_9ZZZZ